MFVYWREEVRMIESAQLSDRVSKKKRLLTYLKTSTMDSLTHIIIEGAHRMPADGVDVLQWPCGEAQDQIQLLCGAGHQVEVMTHRNGR